MRTITIYNTTTGNTKAIAYKMKKVIENYNHEYKIYRDKEIEGEVKNNPQFFDPYDLLLLGS